MSWFKSNPELLKQEEDDLIKSGYEYSIDEIARQNGSLIINVSFFIGEDKNRVKHNLRCVYPSSYPYFAVEVFGQTLPDGRHINPVDYRLCLYEDEQNSWNPSSDTLAKALNEQVPIIVERHKNHDTPSKLEEQVGYQVTGQIRYEDVSVIFVGEEMPPDSISSGKMTYKLNGAENNKGLFSIIGMIDSIDCDTSIIQVSHDVLNERYTKKSNARWVRINTIPHPFTSESLLQEAAKICPEVKTPNFGKFGIDIIGVLIPEESEYRKSAYNWVFIARRRPLKTKKNKRNSNPVIPSLIRCDRYTNDNISKRIPRHKSLANKSIAIIGLGALGSQIAWQLARAGVRSLSLIDYDVVQAGNLPRWLFGFPAIGRLKAEIMADYLIHNYPEIKCKRFNLRIGSGQKYNVDGVSTDAHEFTSHIMEDVDLVIDATAETNVSLYLSNICENISKPYVWATGTQGGWGGIVGRIIPEVTKGTWTTFSYQYADKKIKSPPAEEGSNVQPVGCFSPTFTGSGFDLDHVSLMTARLAVSTLSVNTQEGYPDFDWDVGVLQLWDNQSGLPIAPYWDTYKI